MPKHDPSLIKYQERRLPIERVFNPMKEVEQDGDQVFVPQVHEVFQFKNHERRHAQGVRLGVQKTPHSPFPCVVAEGLLYVFSLHETVKTGQGPQMFRVRADQGHGFMNGVFMER